MKKNLRVICEKCKEKIVGKDYQELYNKLATHAILHKIGDDKTKRTKIKKRTRADEISK